MILYYLMLRKIIYHQEKIISLFTDSSYDVVIKAFQVALSLIAGNNHSKDFQEAMIEAIQKIVINVILILFCLIFI